MLMELIIPIIARSGASLHGDKRVFIHLYLDLVEAKYSPVCKGTCKKDIRSKKIRVQNPETGKEASNSQNPMILVLSQ